MHTVSTLSTRRFVAEAGKGMSRSASAVPVASIGRGMTVGIGRGFGWEMTSGSAMWVVLRYVCMAGIASGCAMIVAVGRERVWTVCKA